MGNKQTESWAYIAGLLDGEGSITKAGYRTHYNVFITNTNLAVLEFVRQIAGGKIQLAKKATSGKYARRGFVYTHRWYLYGESAAQFLRKVAPFLVVKRDIAQKAIDAYYSE